MAQDKIINLIDKVSRVGIKVIALLMITIMVYHVLHDMVCN